MRVPQPYPNDPRGVFYSERGSPLVLHGLPPFPLLTVELEGKWYCAYLVHPNGEVDRVDYDPDNREDEYDHCPTPEACHRLARRIGYTWDTLSLEMIAGRWVCEREDRSDWVVEIEDPLPEFDDRGRPKKRL